MRKIILSFCIVCMTAFAKAQNINAAEFFVDADPGVGNGTTIAVTAGTTVSFTATIPTISLSAGFHFAAIRVRGTDDKWGLFETRGFYISNATTNVGNIIAAEFFIDTDPGAGNGTAIVVTPGGTVSFVASASTISLSQGFHVLAIRTKDISGKWGLFESRGFYIHAVPSNSADMVAAEYFLDADPGAGNGIPVTITPGSNINQNLILNIPPGTPDGQHFLAMRFKDTDGKWGLFDFDTINVAGILPLRLLNFEAARNGNMVLLDWKTDNEVNTSYFDVERSVNGIDFIKLGTISASNRPGVNTYHFTDGQPISGVDLYRLKQVDIDGRVEYSKIVRIFFGTEANMVVYPNPVNDKLNIQLTTVSAKWMTTIYDANGKMVKQEMISQAGNNLQINVNDLAKGSYWVLLNNGLETARAQFLKQ